MTEGFKYVMEDLGARYGVDLDYASAAEFRSRFLIQLLTARKK